MGWASPGCMDKWAGETSSIVRFRSKSGRWLLVIPKHIKIESSPSLDLLWPPGGGHNWSFSVNQLEQLSARRSAHGEPRGPQSEPARRLSGNKDIRTKCLGRFSYRTLTPWWLPRVEWQAGTGANRCTDNSNWFPGFQRNRKMSAVSPAALAMRPGDDFRISR